MKMEDENLKEQVIRDSINFCLEALKIPRKSFWNVKIGMGSIFNVDIHYSRPETPKYLQKLGIIFSLIARQDHTLYGSGGEYDALINFERAREWLDQTIDERVESLAEYPNHKIAIFDDVQSKIVIGDNEIPIPTNTNQFHLCQTILKSKTKKSHKWNWDEIFEAWGDSERIKDNKAKMVIYSTAREINKKVAIGGFKDLFKITTNTVQLNPKYI